MNFGANGEPITNPGPAPATAALTPSKPKGMMAKIKDKLGMGAKAGEPITNTGPAPATAPTTPSKPKGMMDKIKDKLGMGAKAGEPITNTGPAPATASLKPSKPKGMMDNIKDKLGMGAEAGEFGALGMAGAVVAGIGLPGAIKTMFPNGIPKSKGADITSAPAIHFDKLKQAEIGSNKSKAAIQAMNITKNSHQAAVAKDVAAIQAGMKHADQGGDTKVNAPTNNVTNTYIASDSPAARRDSVFQIVNGDVAG